MNSVLNRNVCIGYRAQRFGRAEAYIIVGMLYAIGYIIKASAQGLTALAAGTMVYTLVSYYSHPRC